MSIDKDLLDRLMEGRSPGDLFGKIGILAELTKALAERALSTELDVHLDEERVEEALEGQNQAPNRRNGSSQKTVTTDSGKVVLDIPRDRNGTFDPLLIAKYQRRFPEFDRKIVSMYARGMTTREIQGHIEEIYGVEASPSLISAITDAVLDEVREWQHRALDRMYPIVIFDALRVKIRDADSRMVKNKAVYIALGVTREGEREVLGLWIADNEGAKFWLSVMNELRNRGVQDILIAVVDGLKGFPEAITAAFPDTTVQTCIVHLIRHSMNFCSWKDRKAVAADLRPIYEAPTAEQAARQLDAFEEKWGGKYPSIAPAWRRAWAEVTPFYAFSAAIRKIIYTTNAVESLNRVLRKTLKTKGSFPTEEAATKLIFLAIRNFEKGGRAVREWVAARNQLAIMFAGRFDA